MCQSPAQPSTSAGSRSSCGRDPPSNALLQSGSAAARPACGTWRQDAFVTGVCNCRLQRIRKSVRGENRVCICRLRCAKPLPELSNSGCLPAKPGGLPLTLAAFPPIGAAWTVVADHLTFFSGVPGRRGECANRQPAVGDRPGAGEQRVHVHKSFDSVGPQAIPHVLQAESQVLVRNAGL